MAAKIESPSTISAPREFTVGEGQEDAVQWGRGDHLSPLANVIPFGLMKSLAFVGVTMNDTFTTVAANPEFVTVNNGSIFIRPEFESHLFFESHWIIRAQAGSPAPTTSIAIDLQTWLNQYHVLISPSGFANDWHIEIPPISANQAWEFTQTFVGGIFNLELRKSPNAHIIEFKYKVISIPAGWTQLQIKPRLTLVSAVPSVQVSFVKV